MRVIAEIPHPVMKITVFSWNEKYHIKFEVATFEQTYKIDQMNVSGLEEVKEMINDEFCNKVLGRFVEMRSDFSEAWKRTQTN